MVITELDEALLCNANTRKTKLVIRVHKYLQGLEVTKQGNMKLVTELVTDIPYHETNRKTLCPSCHMIYDGEKDVLQNKTANVRIT